MPQAISAYADVSYCDNRLIHIRSTEDTTAQIALDPHRRFTESRALTAIENWGSSREGCGL
jgi:hypothetical protein